MNCGILFVARIGLLALTLAIDLQGSQAAAVVPRQQFTGTPMDLTEWLVIGPFWENGQDVWENSFFDERGASAEVDLGPLLEHFVAKSSLLNDTTREPGGFPLTNARFIDFLGLFRLPYVAAEPSAAYALSIIESYSDTEAYLLIGSADGVKIWCNGAQLHENPARRGVSTYDDAIRIPLRRGTNTLVIKVCRWRIPWGMTARVEPSAISAAETALRSQGRIENLLLKNGIIQEGEPLDIQPRGLPREGHLEWLISRDQKVVDRFRDSGGARQWQPGASLLPGLYQISVSVNAQHFTETFCVGDPEALAADLLARAALWKPSDRETINLEALRRRTQLLFDPQSRIFKSLGERYAWERKVIWTLSELAQFAKDPKDALGAPGLHLRAFRSRIDGAEQHYRLFIPKVAENRLVPIPIIVVLPTAISANRPFIESAFMASHSEAERMAAIAERYGMGLIWSGYRNKPDGSPAELTHLDEVLEDVALDYLVDESRLSLLGACSGGGMATSIASHWPERFAGLALLNPMFGISKYVSEQTAASFYSLASFRDWMRSGDSVGEFFAENACPTYIIHDGAEPGHGDLSESVRFWRQGVQMYPPVAFQRKIQTLAQHFGAWEDLVRWLSDRRRPEASDRVGSLFSRNQRRDSRISEVFAQPFVVIRGTSGSNETRTAVAKIVDDFATNWLATHYGPCRIINDVDFVASDYRDYNLVLVGNADSNGSWRLWEDAMDLSIDYSQIKLGSRSWQGSSLSIVSMLTRPDNPNRKVVLIGGQNLETARFGTLRLSTEGWFTYAIWSNEGTFVRVVDAGIQ